MSDIVWPARFTPGETDNFVSNEVVVKDLTINELWQQLTNTAAWESYYANVSKISFRDGSGPVLTAKARFNFTTFVFPVIAEVITFVPPQKGQAAHLAWSGVIEGDAEQKLEVVHAWLLEELPGGRVRVLTQESQIGKPAKDMAVAKPNPMLNAHQDWLDGLVRSTRAKKQ